MLIRFSVSNFLSFDEKQELSLEAGKTRKNSDRLYTNRRLRLVKCETLFGANGTGKSNLIKAIDFVRRTILGGFPQGYSNWYYRLNPSNRSIPSEFEIEIICNDKRLCYGFSAILSQGKIEREWLYETTPSNLRKYLYKRNTDEELFSSEDYFKDKQAREKINGYGKDSAGDQELLFLHLINKGKGKMFTDYPELSILRDVFNWFAYKLTTSEPEDVLKGYPYFGQADPDELVRILNALGTGISSLRRVDVPIEVAKARLPIDVYNDIITDLERKNSKRIKNQGGTLTQIMARIEKEFYIFSIDENENKTIETIEFQHETETVFFNLAEESDGTARLFDLIEIFLHASDNSIYVIDEIDRCLHPALTTKVISLFLDMAKNRNTQLIISTHESRLLKNEIMRNDEICFMIKTTAGSTLIKPLDNYQLRSDKKVYEALFDGTLDVLPAFNEIFLNDLISNNV